MMNHRYLLVLILALGVACGKASAPAAGAAKPQSTPATQAQTPAAAPAVKPMPAPLPDVLARVDGIPIQRDEFERSIRTLEARAQQPIPAEQHDEVYRQVLDQLVGFHVLLQEAKARKTAVTPAEVDARLTEIQRQYPDQDTFTKALAGQMLTPEYLRVEIENQMYVTKLLGVEVDPKVSVQEKDVSEFYTQNKERFNEPETIRAAHILIRFPDKADEAMKKKLKAQADGLLKQARGGTDFAKLARENSEDSGSVVNGGELPPFGRGQLTPAFETAAFALKAGQISEVVETPFGYHIIKVLERRAPRVVPLGEVSKDIGGFLTEQQRGEKIAAFIEQLKGKHKVEILI
jgi:peptidyl-prolyl cis-trans isomerase C